MKIQQAIEASREIFQTVPTTRAETILAYTQGEMLAEALAEAVKALQHYDQHEYNSHTYVDGTIQYPAEAALARIEAILTNRLGGEMPAARSEGRSDE